MGPALLTLLLALAAGPPPDGGPTGDRSLQDLLRDARARHAEELAALRPRVEELLGRLEALGPEADRSALAEPRRELARLDPIVAPLLVEALEPGPDPTDARVFRSREAARALETKATSAVTAGLVRLARTGSSNGRRMALHVMGFSEEPERVEPVLAEVFHSSEGALERQALLSLARIGGPESGRLLGEALESERAPLVAVALDALIENRAAAQVESVLALVGQPERAAAHVDGILAYFRACPEVVDGGVLARLCGLSRSIDLELDQRVQVLESLADIEGVSLADAREHVEPLVDQPTARLANAALLCLARLGDRGARRDLMRDYDEVVEDNRTWYRGYERRGEVLLKLGEYEKASRDFKRALQQDVNNREVESQIRVSLARAYALDGKLRNAAETLEGAGLTRAELRALATDPAFVELAAHARHGQVFEMP